MDVTELLTNATHFCVTHLSFIVEVRKLCHLPYKKSSRIFSILMTPDEGFHILQIYSSHLWIWLVFFYSLRKLIASSFMNILDCFVYVNSWLLCFPPLNLFFDSGPSVPVIDTYPLGIWQKYGFHHLPHGTGSSAFEFIDG